MFEPSRVVIDGDVKVKTMAVEQLNLGLRPCEVTLFGKTEPLKGYFHDWVTVDEQKVSTRKTDTSGPMLMRVVRGIVEFSDGTVGLVKLSDITFVDSDEAGEDGIE